MKKLLTFVLPIMGVFLTNGVSFPSIIIGALLAGLCLFLSCFTFLINKGKSFWKAAFVLSICMFFLLVLASLAKMNMQGNLL